ncbi:SAM-dependent DNA methyltransferase [Mucilaginibacter sp. JRF]|uniref:N-6 DNA methylase n=1 Tax=Mucilaginibacter sp. JRF TaxID=2780088 RepID=UPI001882934B|nr:N-6 DNA methylase [Mucilaginibacter sp. JRF]MBE9584026.1 SAM-dependent DNA methyltransferase [Mucilaginibacter sp. JRF]
MTDFKQLLTAFERFAYGQSLHTAFVDMLDWMLLPFKLHNDSASQRTSLEAYRGHKKADKLVQLIKLIGDLSENFSDPLGELFMQAISNGHNGQYFTPEPICDMMSAITIGALEDGQTVCDPACGSGRMLLAAAKLNRHAKFYGADLDITCCKMALVNMLLNSLTGEIAHMNTLSNEFYTGYKVNTTLVAGYHQPYFMEFSKPENSYIWLKPLKAKEAFDKPFVPVKSSVVINGVQGSLF